MSNELTTTSKAPQVDAVINNHVALAMGAGLIPLPLVDVAAISAVHYKMLKDISAVYGVEFVENRVKSIVASLLTGLGSTSVAAVGVRSLAKLAPGLGSLFGIVTLPVVAGAFTYAVGKVFVQHFESGGTFLNFDSLDAKSGLTREFEKGKTCVSETARSFGKKASDFSTKIENKIDNLIEAGCC
jgi:uncharacterized protein (DUF697 family)